MCMVHNFLNNKVRFNHTSTVTKLQYCSVRLACILLLRIARSHNLSDSPTLQPFFHAHELISETFKYKLSVLLNSINNNAYELPFINRNTNNNSLSRFKNIAKYYVLNYY